MNFSQAHGDYLDADGDANGVAGPVSPSLSMSHNSGGQSKKTSFSGLYCPVCGMPIPKIVRGRPRAFCSVKCREISADERGQVFMPFPV